MESKPLLLGFGVLFIGIIGMGFIDNADALKSKGNPSTSYGSSSGVCGDKLCSEIETTYDEYKKSPYMKKQQDKMMKEDMMINEIMSEEYDSLDVMVKSKINSILDETDYSMHHIMDTINQLDNYLSTLDESALQQIPIKEITNIIFYAQYNQMPLEFAIYEIYEILE